MNKYINSAIDFLPNYFEVYNYNFLIFIKIKIILYKYILLVNKYIIS